MRKTKLIVALCLTAMTWITAMTANVVADWETEIGRSDNVISTKDLKEGEAVDVGNGAAGKVISVEEAEAMQREYAEIVTREATEANIAEDTASKPDYTTKMVKVVLTDSVPDIYCDNKKVIFDSEPFIDENDRTQVPIRAVAEMLGFTVEYDDNMQKIKMYDSYRTVILTIGSPTIIVNNDGWDMDTTARIKDNRTYIPLRYVMEAFGCGVIWE